MMNHALIMHKGKLDPWRIVRTCPDSRRPARARSIDRRLTHQQVDDAVGDVAADLQRPLQEVGAARK